MRAALPAVLLWCVLSCCAVADTTLGYRGDADCAGDFDQVRMKDSWLRMDAHQGSDSSSMIYDGAEKLVTFVDHGQHRFMQAELDEDAIDLQKDIMASLNTKMRRETGVDMFAMAKSLCPGMDGAAVRDRLPDDVPACGNALAQGAAMIGADGKPMNQQQVEAAMKDGRMPAIDTAGMQQMLQKQMAAMPPEQQAQMQQLLAGAGGSMLPSAKAGAPSRPVPRIDRDAGEMRIGDITCLRRQHLRGEQMLREDCQAPVAALPFNPVEARRIARFSKAMHEWSRSFDTGETQQASDDRVLIQRICYRDGHESGRTTLRIDHAPIAESQFAVPAGYTPFDLGTPGSR